MFTETLLLRQILLDMGIWSLILNILQVCFRQSINSIYLNMMMPLIVKCESCGFEHHSIYQMDRDSFQDPAVIMTNQNENCLRCGQVSTYDKSDYSFIEVK